jgi:PQQ-dependent dehydrogenase (methanol/ethanol family)
MLLLASMAAAEAPGPAAETNSVAADWPSHGRTNDEQRHSPLMQIHRENVSDLGLAWNYATGTRRGMEATPLVVDGTLYATGSWSAVYAIDAASGAPKWTFDPAVPKRKGRNACCDVVNRGVAFFDGRVYVGTIDGRLIALDAESGAVVWDTLTVDPEQAYTITGAPRIVKGLVVIGNGGADLGVRGYFSAYDAQTGQMRWRFYTVPGSKTGPHEHPELEFAATTWSKDSMWETGLGGTVWDSFAYDPELDLLYAGVGNASVYDRAKRSPGGGDNLFLTSILAIRPDTGRLVWHYQTTPAESWDYTATQHMILADLEIGGRLRRVLMQAPKNGFFYVLDRATGELLSAEPYVYTSWATHVDPKTGRPVERPEADWSQTSRAVTPGPPGGHNWHPMTYSPKTGLVYIPSTTTAYAYYPDADYRFIPRTWNTAEDMGAMHRDMETVIDVAVPCSPAHLTAWDPVAAQTKWRVDYDEPVPGGLLSTSGGVVFQGSGRRLIAYDDRDGAVLWETATSVGLMAPPITYAIDGVQYVAVVGGLGGSHGGHLSPLSTLNEGQVFAFKLGGKAPMPKARSKPPFEVRYVPPSPPDHEAVARGRDLYGRHCFRCHGVGAVTRGIYTDLRASTPETHQTWNDIVLGGTRQSKGMPTFADIIDVQGAQDIRAYVIARAIHAPGLLERVQRQVLEWGCVPVTWFVD